MCDVKEFHIEICTKERDFIANNGVTHAAHCLLAAALIYA
jgi:hypothetical protein